MHSYTPLTPVLLSYPLYLRQKKTHLIVWHVSALYSDSLSHALNACNQSVALFAYLDGVADIYFAVDNQFAYLVLYVGLDGTLQRSGAELYVIALFCNKLLCLVANLKCITY